MGINITSPTQIPVNVVEIGNEISQNAINAISASVTPSAGNPFSTSSELSSGLGLKANLVSPSFTGSITTPKIDNPLNTNLVVHTYNDVGAGTHYNHTFAALDGTYVLPPNGGGLVFPDGSIQTTATVQGIQGTQGPQGPQGDAGGSFPDVYNDNIPYIRYNQSWQALSNYDQSGGIGDAPVDGSAYVRYNGSWQLFSNYDQNSGGGGGGGIGEAPYNGTAYIRVNNDWQPLSSYDQNSGIGDAPADSQAYVRYNNNWQLFSNYDQNSGGGGGGGISDAPYDSTSYVRINNTWAQTFRDFTPYNSSGDPFYPYEVKITVNGTDYWVGCRPV